MHIPDGFLSGRVAVSMIAVSGAAVLYAAHRVREEVTGRLVPIMGVLSAFVLAAQMLNFPLIGGTSGHLLGGALLGILLGPMAGLLAMTSVVVAQALFFQDGGLMALGANTFNIGALTVFSGSVVFRGLHRGSFDEKRLVVAGFSAGWISSMLSAGSCAIVLALSGSLPLNVGLPVMSGYHALIGIAEGALTGGILSFLAKVRPDLLRENLKTPLAPSDWIGVTALAGIPLVVLALAGSSSLPDPLQSLIEPTASGADDVSQPFASPDRVRDSLGISALILGLSVLAYAAVRLAKLRRRRS